MAGKAGKRASERGIEEVRRRIPLPVANGATGVYFHSICRTTRWPEDSQKKIADGVSKLFKELAGSGKK